MLCPLALLVQAYGYELPKDIEYIYTNVRKTHNTGVFDAYTDEMKRARKSGILTGGWFESKCGDARCGWFQHKRLLTAPLLACSCCAAPRLWGVFVLT